jgi:hypothetical protein
VNSFVPPLKFTVIADTDNGLSYRYLDPNGECNYVPQDELNKTRPRSRLTDRPVSRA